MSMTNLFIQVPQALVLFLSGNVSLMDTDFVEADELQMERVCNGKL